MSFTISFLLFFPLGRIVQRLDRIGVEILQCLFRFMLHILVSVLPLSLFQLRSDWELRSLHPTHTLSSACTLGYYGVVLSRHGGRYTFDDRQTTDL